MVDVSNMVKIADDWKTQYNWANILNNINPCEYHLLIHRIKMI